MTDYSELKRLAEAAKRDQNDYAALNDYGMAMPPAVALALIAEVDRLYVSVGYEEARFRLELAESERLRRENEALRKDAERYRWLRDRSESIHQFYLSTPIWFAGVKFSKDNVDGTIDAAMSQGEQAHD